ncbi:MAG: hypothetical protein HFF18_05510 [Oscillospiraceae bacterium]|nr:hypothetical protein [Oscillospiraceae bacterium]
MLNEPVNPCVQCEHAPCRLPLNCRRWNAYLTGKRKAREDAAALAQAQIYSMGDFDSADTKAWRQKMALACPWVLPGPEERPAAKHARN